MGDGEAPGTGESRKPRAGLEGRRRVWSGNVHKEPGSHGRQAELVMAGGCYQAGVQVGVADTHLQ